MGGPIINAENDSATTACASPTGPHDICVSCHLTKTSLSTGSYLATFILYLSASAEPIEGHAMHLDLFSRKLVLLVEDEPLIAHDVEHALRKAGARVITAGHLDAALYMTEHPQLSAAVVDLRLGDESAIPILRRLAHRHLPFVVHTGYVADEVQREWPVAPIIQKPATPDRIAEALAHSLRPLASNLRDADERNACALPPKSVTSASYVFSLSRSKRISTGGRPHAEEDRPEEAEVQKLRRKRNSQKGRQGRSVSTVRRKRHQTVKGASVGLRFSQTR